jgi:maltose alpha-D-glucosyltransferase/alpha-amylase
VAKKTVHPVIESGPYSSARVNVEAQRRDRNSMLNWTGRMIRLRKECPEIGWGDWQILPTGSSSVLAMRYDWRGNSLVVVHNFASVPLEVTLRPEVEGGELLVNLIENDRSESDDKGAHKISLEAHGYRWYRVGGLNYALKPNAGTEKPQKTRAPRSASDTK